jgi:hypothetical protein
MQKLLHIKFIVLLLLITSHTKGQIIYNYAGDLNGIPEYVDPNATGTSLFTIDNQGFRCDTGYTVQTYGNDPFMNPQIGPFGDFNYDANGRIDFTIIPNAGYQLNITSVTILAGRLPFGPTDLKLGMNINGLGIIEGAAMNSLPNECQGDPNAGIPNAVPNTLTWDFNDINSTAPVSFTIAAFGGLNNIAIIYQVIVSGTVTPAQTIPVVTAYSHPGLFVYCQDEPVVLSVTANGTPSPSIQWQDVNGNDILGATASTYILPLPLQNGYYRAKVYNSYGTTYTPYTHIYPFASFIDAGPDQFLCTGDPAMMNSNSAPGNKNWTSLGDGFFDDQSLDNPIYYPGTSDVSAGFVNLILTDEITTDWQYTVCFREDTLTLFIGTPPQANAGNDQSIMQTNTTLNGNTPSPGHGIWSVIAGSATFADSSLYNTTVSGLSNGNNILRWTVGMGSCSSFDDVTILVTSNIAGAISGDTSICAGGTAQLKIDFTGTGPFDYSYTDGSTTYGPFVATANPEFLNVAPVANTNYSLVSVSVGGNAGAVSGSALITVNTVPPSTFVTVPFAGMPANVCSGTIANLSVAAVPNATKYIWDAPSGSYFSGNPLNGSPYTTTAPNVLLTFGAPSGSLYSIGVQAANACGASLRQQQKVRGILSVPAAISGALTACENTSVAYSTAPVTAAISYQWSITGDATVSGTGTTVMVTFGPSWNGGTLCVAAQTSCYTSPTKCISIGKNASILNTISGSFTVCPNSASTYIVPASSGAASYTWTLPAGATGSSTTNSINVSFGPSYNNGGNICVSVTSVCGITSVPKCKTITPGLLPTPSSITGALSGVCNQALPYSCPSQGGAAYNWTAPSGATVTGNGSSTVSIAFSTLTTGPVCVTAANACGARAPRCITVKGAPGKPGALTANPATWCAPAQGIQLSGNTANLTGSYNLQWAIVPATAASIQSGNGTNQITANWNAPGIASVQLKAYNTCGSSTKTLPLNISICRLSEEVAVNPVLTFVIYPNPASEIINCAFISNTNGEVQIALKDIAGRIVTEQVIKTITGKNLITIDVNYMVKGIYYLQVKSTEGNNLYKIIIE